MKSKWMFFLGFLSLCASGFAENVQNNIHFHPQLNTADPKLANTRFMIPGYCQIEIVNATDDPVQVSGFFDNGYYLDPFMVYSYDRPGFLGYVSLVYYDSYYSDFTCHSGMSLYIDDTYTGRRIYSRYTSNGASIKITSAFLSGQLEAAVSAE